MWPVLRIRPPNHTPGKSPFYRSYRYDFLDPVTKAIANEEVSPANYRNAHTEYGGTEYYHWNRLLIILVPCPTLLDSTCVYSVLRTPLKWCWPPKAYHHQKCITTKSVSVGLPSSQKGLQKPPY